MGNWFSSDAPEVSRPQNIPVNRRQYSFDSDFTSYNYSRPATSSYSYPSRTSYYDDEPSYVARRSPVVVRREPVYQRASVPENRFLATPNIDLHITVKNHMSGEWSSMDIDEEKTFISLAEWEVEFIRMKNLFLRTTKKSLVNVDSIERIQNPFLQGRYFLKKIKMAKLYNEQPREEYLFHGTKLSKVDAICSDNLDYRKTKRHLYGCGVSFSTISHYASCYSDRRAAQQIILVFKVLTCKPLDGNENITYPGYYDKRNYLRYDCTEKEGRKVVVKFDDDEFYPAYKITFSIKNPQAYYQKK